MNQVCAALLLMGIFDNARDAMARPRHVRSPAASQQPLPLPFARRGSSLAWVLSPLAPSCGSRWASSLRSLRVLPHASYSAHCCGHPGFLRREANEEQEGRDAGATVSIAAADDAYWWYIGGATLGRVGSTVPCNRVTLPLCAHLRNRRVSGGGSSITSKCSRTVRWGSRWYAPLTLHSSAMHPARHPLVYTPRPSAFLPHFPSAPRSLPGLH